MQNKKIKNKLIIKIMLGIVTLGVVSGAITGVVIATKKSHITPKIKDTLANHQMINKDIVNWIYDNLWYSDADHKNAIPIGTTPDSNSDNAGVSLVTNSNGAVSWQVKILTGTGSMWTQYTILNLGNPQDEKNLITKIQNTDTWTKQAQSGKNLYPIHDLSVVIVKNYFIKFINDYPEWKLDSDSTSTYKFVFDSYNGGVARDNLFYNIYLKAIAVKDENKKADVIISLKWSTVKNLNYSSIFDFLKNQYHYMPIAHH